MDRRRDPRSIVTPYAFAVHPDLLGRPLATPWQRLGAILVDLVVIGVLSLVGGGPLAFASALLLLWLAFKKPGRDVFGKLFRIAVGCLGVLVLLVAIGVIYAIRHSDEIAEAVEEATAGASEEGFPVVAEGASGASDTAAAVDVETPDSTAAPEEAVPTLTDTAALDSIAALNDRIAVVREERDDYRDRLEDAEEALDEAESGGLFEWLRDLIDDVGLGFGWAALYMTITHAWWKGTSVGKRLFRIRVVMIDKRPLNWWLSFERAGGYAAGFATGLLGFVQVFWDPNRQAIHDKVSETIVIQEGKDPVPGPWVEEGRAQWARQDRRPGAGWTAVLLLPFLLGCGGDGEARNTESDSVVQAILSAAAAESPARKPQPPRRTSPRLAPEEQEARPLEVAEMGFNHGSADAPVKVLEFTDFGCGYCRRFHQETYPTVADLYIDAGLVEWKHVPFVLGRFPNGLQAAMAAECAGEQDAFLPMHARLFEDQQTWKVRDDPYDLFVEMAREEGLDAARLKSCLEGGWRENALRDNLRLAAEVGVRGTPTFIIDGKVLPGFLPLSSFRDVLDMALQSRGITPPER